MRVVPCRRHRDKVYMYCGKESEKSGLEPKDWDNKLLTARRTRTEKGRESD